MLLHRSRLSTSPSLLKRAFNYKPRKELPGPLQHKAPSFESRWNWVGGCRKQVADSCTGLSLHTSCANSSNALGMRFGFSLCPHPTWHVSEFLGIDETGTQSEEDGFWKHSCTFKSSFNQTHPERPSLSLAWIYR